MDFPRIQQAYSAFDWIFPGPVSLREKIGRDADAHGDGESGQVVPADEKERLPASCINSALFCKEAAHIPRELQVTLVFVDFTHGEVHRTVKKARSRHFHA